MKQIRWFLVAAFGVIALVFSCQEEEYCTLPLVSRVNIGFYGMQEGELVPKPVNKFWSAGLGQDSVINGDSTDVDKLVLELSDSQDSCTFVFTSSIPDTNFTDTLKFLYLRQLDFVSYACGYAYIYRLQSIDYTQHLIDTILITNPTINTSGEENVQILF